MCLESLLSLSTPTLVIQVHEYLQWIVESICLGFGEYPNQYKQLQTLDENLVRDIVSKALEEISATGAGASAATFTPGEGANYATPTAFNPNKNTNEKYINVIFL